MFVVEIISLFTHNLRSEERNIDRMIHFITGKAYYYVTGKRFDFCTVVLYGGGGIWSREQ